MTTEAKPAWSELDFKKLGEAMQGKQRELKEIFDSHPDIEKMPADVAVTVKPLNDELSAMGERFDELKALEEAKALNGEHERKAREAINRPGQPSPEEGQKTRKVSYKDAGLAFVESKSFQSWEERGGSPLGISVDMPTQWLHPGFKGDGSRPIATKDVLGTDSSLATVDTQYQPEVIRLPGIYEPLEFPNRVASLFPQGTTMQNAIAFMEESTTTNAAAETAEGAAKPESALDFQEVSTPVRKIATWIPVTEEAFADTPALRAYVNARLRTFVLQREDAQLLNGDGIAPNLLGLLNNPGIQTQPIGTDTSADAIFKATTALLVNAGGQAASDVVLHPSDWQDIRLSKTTQDVYFWGPPSEPGAPRIWGLPVTITTAIPAGTGLVGAFSSGNAMIMRRESVNVRVADQHADFAVTNKIALIAEERLALVVFRPSAFVQVTGI